MKNILKTSLLVLIVLSLSAFTSKKTIPAAIYIGNIVLEQPNSANLEGTYKVYVSESDPTKVIFILKTIPTGIIYTSGEYSAEHNHVQIAKDGVYFFDGQLEE